MVFGMHGMSLYLCGDAGGTQGDAGTSATTQQSSSPEDERRDQLPQAQRDAAQQDGGPRGAAPLDESRQNGAATPQAMRQGSSNSQPGTSQRPPVQPGPPQAKRQDSSHSQPRSPRKPPSSTMWGLFRISRKTSGTSSSAEEFEKSAEPMESNAFGNAGTSTLPMTTPGLSYSNLAKEIVLRIEVPDDREMKVSQSLFARPAAGTTRLHHGLSDGAIYHELLPVLQAPACPSALQSRRQKAELNAQRGVCLSADRHHLHQGRDDRRPGVPDPDVHAAVDAGDSSLAATFASPCSCSHCTMCFLSCGYCAHRRRCCIS